MLLSKCPECLNNKRGKCKAFPNGKPKNYQPYIDECDDVSLPMSNVAQAAWETFPAYGKRILHPDGPYNAEFLAKCKEKYREYQDPNFDDFLRQDSINLLLKCIPYHFRQKVLNG